MLRILGRLALPNKTNLSRKGKSCYQAVSKALCPPAFCSLLGGARTTPMMASAHWGSPALTETGGGGLKEKVLEIWFFYQII